MNNNGPGIDPYVFGLLFTKFAVDKGDGVGLYICKKIIEAHGRTKEARNNSNLGDMGQSSRSPLPRDR